MKIILKMSKLEEQVRHLQGLINRFREHESDSQIEKTSEELMQFLGELKKLSFEKNRDGILLAKLNSSAVTLWNLSVALKSGKKTNNLVNAKARHVACHLTFLASATEMTESSWRRKLPLALKAGKSWLDCSHAKMADECFVLASECWTKLQMIKDSKLTECQPTLKDEQQRQDCELSMLKLCAYRSEVAFISADDEASKEHMQKAKHLLSKFPKQCTLLATFCYNFGVEYFQKGHFDKSISWLRESYEMGKGIEGVAASSSKTQATCLRLIAKAYIETGIKENVMLALNSIDLSLSEESNPRSLYLKLKIILHKEDENDEGKISVLEDCINHPDIKIDLGLQTIKLLTNYKSPSLTSKGFEMLMKRFQKPHEVTKIQMQQFEHLLEEKQQQVAKELIKSTLIAGVKQLPQADGHIMKKFHLLVWEQAAMLYEADLFEDALSWYNFSLDCFANSVQESKNIAKLQRNRASCFLGMKQFEKASDAIQEAHKLDADCVQTYFIHFKICLESTDDEKAINCIEKISELALEETDAKLIHGFICLAAQMAFQDGNKKVAATALEKIIQQTGEPKQILTALRCLTRLKYTYLSPMNQSEEIKGMLGFVKKAYETLQANQKPEFEPEVQWFVKIAWNLGLHCQENHIEMFSFFVLCYEFSQLMPENCNKVQQRTCLLMASAAGIETAKTIKDDNEKNGILKDVISYIQKCERIYQECKKTQQLNDKPDTTLAMLVCLEFEAKARLGYSNIESIIDKARALSHVDTKTFEAIAATAFDISQKYKQVGIKALKIAIKLHLGNQEPDYLQLSKDLHTLVSISIEEGGSSNAQSKEEAFQYYQHILEIIQQAPKNSYPEMETLWLMTKAWNCGVYLFSAHEFESCERWCGMALKLLDQLDSLKTNYDSHMTTVFADILERRERLSLRNQMEE